MSGGECRTTTESGRLGERAAAEYLVSKGFAILHMNYHVSHLEIDIIAEDARRIIFVEVKTRTESDSNRLRYGRPAAAVTKAKQARLVFAADAYIRTNKPGKRVRIDVIEVYISPGENPQMPPRVSRINPTENAVFAR